MAGPVLLLFDIDGTILRAAGAGMRAMATVAKHIFGPQFSWQGIDASGRLDPSLFVEAAQRNGMVDYLQHHDRFRDLYIHELREELARTGPDVRLMPGIAHVLDILHQRAETQKDVVLGLLTGNYPQAVPLKFFAVGLDPAIFTINVFGDQAPTRPDLVALALQRFEQQFDIPADPNRTLIIGDTTKDIACAKAHHCRCLAVATGGNTFEELQQAHPDQLLHDLSDPTPLWKLIASLSPSPLA